MHREDVERLVERLRQTAWGNNVADTLCAWERDRQKAADLIEALTADLDQGARDYCDLMARHDAHFSAWQSAKMRAERAEAERDALQGQLNDLRNGWANSVKAHAALLAERDTLKKVLEREKADHRACITKSGGKIRALLARLDIQEKS